MFPQVPSLGEHLPTCWAAERLLPRVDTLVDLYLLWPVKGFATVTANEKSFLGAGSMMYWAAVAEGQGQQEAGAVTSTAIHTWRGWWEISRRHRVWTREPLSFHPNPRGLIEKLLNQRVSTFIVTQQVKLWVPAVIDILLWVYGFLQGVFILNRVTEFTVKKRRGVTDLHSSAAVAVAACRPGPADLDLGILLFKPQSLSRNSTMDTFQHSFKETRRGKG